MKLPTRNAKSFLDTMNEYYWGNFKQMEIAMNSTKRDDFVDTLDISEYYSSNGELFCKDLGVPIYLSDLKEMRCR